MTRLRRLLLGGAVLVLVAAAGLFALARATQGVQAAPNCGGNAKLNTTPPAQLVSAADFFTQGDYDYDQGDCEAAIAGYTRALALDPQMAEAYNNRAYTYMAQQNYAAALADLNQAIALRPDYVNALMNRGDIYNYYYDIDYDKAVADYDRVLALKAQNTSVCGHRLLAQHRGWDLGVLVTVVMQGGQAGCG